MTKTTEWCSCCNKEVEIKAILEPQKCPNCGKEIFACAYCREQNGDCNPFTYPIEFPEMVDPL